MEIKYNKDGSVAKKRGRPKKNKLPEEIQKIVDDVERQQHEEFTKILLEEKDKRQTYWDIPKDAEIKYFDANLSYEITGYRPINEVKGLDFNPDWFTETRTVKEKTGHYSSFHFGTKAYSDFWKELYRRCREGYTVNGYTITGDHYFFLNFYQLKDSRVSKAGIARKNIFPRFMQALYEFFHYYELCKVVRKNVCMMKSRAVGFSEIMASLCATEYSCFRNSITIITAPDKVKLDKTLEKVWGVLTYLNDHTDGGFFKLRQVVDNALVKRASFKKKINGQDVEDGWMSLIEGIVADKPSKVRGDRAEVVIFEEAGSNSNLETSFVQGEALVNVGGNKLGILIAGGTGGDSNAALEGLRKIYYNPESFDVLPFRHNMVDTNETVLTGFFVPSYKALDREGLVDNRGVCNISKCKEFYNKERAKKDPQSLVKYAAEFCFTAEEAFALEGNNKFNKALIAEQLTKIRALKQCPPIDKGYFTFNYLSGKPHRVEGGNISDVVWHSDDKLPKVKILEHPVWTQIYQNKEEARIRKLQNDGIDIEPFKPIEKQLAMYVIGVDGIDIGQAQTSDETKDPSDFCAVVLKRVYGVQDPQLVAIYKHRPQDIREAYQTVIALSMYYNCLINIEATRMSFCNWAKSVKLLNWFMKRPKATYPDINKIKSTQYGSPATLMVILHQTDLIANFVEDYYFTIWFEEVLDELNRYNDENKRKFDIIAALGMAMLADEELNGVAPRAVLLDNSLVLDIGYYIDENGHRRFGIIPKDFNKTNLTYNPNYYEDDTGTIRTSNPRIFYGGIW